jgi:hypothetical protein
MPNTRISRNLHDDLPTQARVENSHLNNVFTNASEPEILPAHVRKSNMRKARRHGTAYIPTSSFHKLEFAASVINRTSRTKLSLTSLRERHGYHAKTAEEGAHTRT